MTMNIIYGSGDEPTKEDRAMRLVSILEKFSNFPPELQEKIVNFVEELEESINKSDGQNPGP